jgi:hypothetical protein
MKHQKSLRQSMAAAAAMLLWPSVSQSQTLVTKTGTSSDSNVIPATNVAFGNMLGVSLQWKGGTALLEDHIQKTKDLGAKYVRIDMDRSFIGWDYSKVDFIITKTRTLGLNVMFNVMRYGGGPPGTSANAPDQLAEYDDYGQFMQYFQDRVRGETHIFCEFWNEPNFELFWGGSPIDAKVFRRFLERPLDGIKVSRDWYGLTPAYTIKGISGGPISNVWNEEATGDYIATMLKNDWFNYLPIDTMKYIGYHPYFWSQGKFPERRKQIHDSMVAKRNAKGENRPFAVTEWGYPSTIFDSDGNTLQLPDSVDVKQDFPGWEAVARNRQALLNQRQALIEWAIGTPIAIYYTMADGDLLKGTYNHLDREQNFGLIDNNGNPKPNWHRLKEVVTMTSGFSVQGICKLTGTNSSDVWAIKFRRTNNSNIVRYALWVANRGAQASPKIEKEAGKKLRQLAVDSAGTVYTVQTLNGSRTAPTQTTHPLNENDGVRWYEVSNL